MKQKNEKLLRLADLHDRIMATETRIFEIIVNAIQSTDASAVGFAVGESGLNNISPD